MILDANGKPWRDNTFRPPVELLNEAVDAVTRKSRLDALRESILGPYPLGRVGDTIHIRVPGRFR